MARVVRMRIHPEPSSEKLAVGIPEVFWPDTRGTEPFLKITVGDIILYLEGLAELNELFGAFAPLPDKHYLDL